MTSPFERPEEPPTSQLIKHNGQVVNPHRAALGISAIGLTDQSGQPVGVSLGQLLPAGAAAQAGLRVGDVFECAGRW